MSNFSSKLLRLWLTIPREVRKFSLNLIVFFVVGLVIFKGLSTLLNFDQLEGKEVLVSAVAAIVIVTIIRLTKRES